MPVVIFLVTMVFSSFLFAAAPYVDPRTDAEHFGDPDEFLFWKGKMKVAGFRNIQRLFPTRKIEAGGDVYPLKRNLKDLSDFTYRFKGKDRTIDDFIDLGDIVGLLVVRNDEILLERYAAGNDENSLWVSYSISKSVTSMLLGAAVRDGYINSVDERVSDYLPRLKGTPYEDATIKNLLQMSSGAAWNEDYADPKSDVNNTPGGIVNLINYLASKDRVATPGDKFNYNTGETNLTGAVVRAAIGNNLATYLTDKIWIPFGMESDANWLLEGPYQGELGGCCISATLRDYARLGIFALNGGELRNGRQVLAGNWMRDSTRPSKGFDGYGYLWWLFGDGVFGALGIFGQSIFVDPRNKTVVVTQSAWNTAVGEDYQDNRRLFIQALLKAL